jgi:hypothetical protein
MVTNIAIFLASFAASVFYTSYTQALREDKAVLAGLWAAILTLLASSVIISIIDKNASLAAMMFGAFIGTWLGIKVK